MSRAFAGSTGGSYLQADKPVVLAPPFTVAGHFRTSQPTRSTTGYLWWLGKRTSSADWWAVVMLNGKLGIEARDLAENYSTVYTTNSIAANAAQHFVATFADDDERKLVLNDTPASAAISTASRSPATPDRTSIGRASDSTPSGGWLGDVAHIAVWNRVLTAEEQSALAKGANPQSISGLVDYFEIDGASSPETGVLGTDVTFAVTGAPKATFNPTIQPYTPPPVGGDGSVKKAWVSDLLPVKLTDRDPTISFPARTVPTAAGRKLIAEISLTAEFSSTSIVAVTFGGNAMTPIGDNGYGGPQHATIVSAWELTTIPTGASQLVVTCDKNLWSGSACLTAVDDWGAPIVVAGDPGAYSEAAGNTAQQTIATEPGSLVLFVASAQGADTAPAGITWTNAVIDAQGKTPSTSETTDHSVVFASKSVISGTSETPKATFATSDGRGWLALSIPPASSSTPAGAYVAGKVSVNDTNYESAVTGTVARAQIIEAVLDATANQIRISLDGATDIVASWSGSENAVTGDIILGAALNAGAVQSGNKLKMLGIYGSTAVLSSAQRETARKWAAQLLAPVTTALSIGLPSGEISTIDLTSSVKDPSGWGWEIVGVDRPEPFIVTILDDHRLSIDLIGATGGVIEFAAQLASKHPTAPASSIQIRALVDVVDVPDVTASTSEGNSVLVNVLSGVTDSDGQALTLTSVSDPESGTAVIESGWARYTPDADFSGADSFVFTATALSGAIGSGTVNITVLPAGSADPPEPDFTAFPTSGAAPLDVQFTYTGTAASSFEWDAGGTNKSEVQSPKFTFYSQGAKSVKLTATGPGGSKSITKTGIITVTSGSTSPPPPPTGSYPFDLPELMVSNFDSLSAGMTWSGNFSAIGSCFRSNTHVVTVWENSGKKPVNAKHIDVQRPGVGEPLALRVRYPERTSTYKDGGGCNWGIFVNSGVGTALSLTNGFRRAAISWDCYFPSDFANVNAGIGRPFKFGGMAGGPFNGGFSGNPWSDGQGVGPEEGMYFPSNTVHKSRGVPIGPGPDRGWSLRWQGTGRYDDDKGLIKPLPSVSDRRADKTTDPNWTVAAHYGRWQPSYVQERVRRGAWNTFQIYFEGNTAGNHDGTIEYWINGVKVFSVYDAQYRRYATLAHTLWLGTFFGGTPITDPTDGSPQDNELFFRNFRFAGSRT